MGKIDFNKSSKSLAVCQAAVFVFLSICVVFPLLCVLLAVKFQDFENVFSSEIFIQAVKNTFAECLASSFCSVLIGYIFAYAVVKAKIPFRRFFSFVPLIHLMTPPFVGGLSFILLLGRQGFITYQLLGLNVSLYGFWGLLIAQSLCFFPMAYLICLQSLLAINPNLEQAARSLGAGNFKIFATITFPLTFPGILSSFLFVAANVLSDFGNPLIVAGRFRVLAVEIYTQLTGWLNAGSSAVLGIVLIVPSVILFTVQNRLLKKNMPKISGIGGKNAFAGQGITKLSGGTGLYDYSDKAKVSDVLIFLLVLFISGCVLAQFVAIVAGSFQKIWGVNTAFTVQHFSAVKRYSRSLFNSVFFALTAAALSTLIAGISSYIVHRTDSRLKNFFDVFSQLPSSIPGSLLGLAISIAAGKLNFRFAPVLILIAMSVAFMPFSYRIISQSYAQISLTLDDSSRSLGANQITTLFKVIVPVSANGIFSGFIYDFIRGVGTLSAVIFLVSFNTPLTSIDIVNLAEQGDWGKSCALAVILTFITFLILGLGYGIVKVRERKILL